MLVQLPEIMSSTNSKIKNGSCINITKINFINFADPNQGLSSENATIIMENGDEIVISRDVLNYLVDYANLTIARTDNTTLTRIKNQFQTPGINHYVAANDDFFGKFK